MWLCDEIGCAHREGEGAGETMRCMSVEVIFKLLADRIEVRLQFISHFSDQLGRGKISDDNGTVFAKGAGLRLRRIRFREVLDAHDCWSMLEAQRPLAVSPRDWRYY